MRIGIFGGSFDPVHYAHLSIAQAAAEIHSLERVFVVPNDEPSYRKQLTAYHHRYAMVCLALQNDKLLIPSDIEAGTHESYTVDTVQSLRIKNGYKLGVLNDKNETFLIMGMDSYLTLPNWHQADKLTGYCQFVVSHRPGFPEFTQIPKTDFFAAIQHQTKFMTQLILPVSATDIRMAIKSRDVISRHLLHPKVLDYIKKTGLYR